MKFRSSLRLIGEGLDSFYYANHAKIPNEEDGGFKKLSLSLLKHFTNFTSKYSDFDYVVVGSNYLLNLIAARSLSQTDKTCLICQTSDNDSWFYNITRKVEYRKLIEQNVNLIAPDSLSGEGWVDYIFKERLPFGSSNIAFIDENIFYVGSFSENEVFFVDDDTFDESFVNDDNFLNPFRNYFNKLNILDYGVDKKSVIGRFIEPIPYIRGLAYSRKIIRAKKVILTSQTPTIRAQSYDNGDSYVLNYESKNILPFGSAHEIPKKTVDFVNVILDDIYKLNNLER